MNKKYAIISDSFYDDGRWKSFYVLIDNLTKEQVLGLKEAIPQYFLENKSKHPLNIKLKVKGFSYEISGDDFQEYLMGKIIPMWTLENFE